MKAVEKLVPELRFSGFKNQWISERLNNVLVLKSRPFKMDDESEYSLVTVKRRYGGVVSRGIFKGKEIKVKSQFKLEENDFIISKRQISHNACGIVPKDLEGSIVSNEYSVFKPKLNLNIIYFNYFCHLPKISHSFFLSSIGVHIEKMLFRVDDWLKWRFCFPTTPEQQKIAAFLSAVDKKIEKLTRKKELLELYKKGGMQKIFSREIRFKDDDGKDFPDWREKRLGDIGAFIAGVGFPEKEQGGSLGIPVYKVSDMNLKGNEFFMTTSNNYVTDNQIKKINFKPILKESIVFAKVGAAIFLERKRVANKFLIDNNMMAFSPNGNILFFKFVFETIRLSKFAQVGALPSYNASGLATIKVKIPIDIEQEKIVSFLININKKIEAVQVQLTKTQTFKKSLLQKMFV